MKRYTEKSTMELWRDVAVIMTNHIRIVMRKELTVKRPTRWYSNKQEKKVAKAIQGKQVSNSGATAFSKGDVRTQEWLIECKTCTTEKKSFSIKKDWLEKNKEEAFAMNKSYSALAFDFGDGHNYYIVDERTFIHMKEALEDGSTSN